MKLHVIQADYGDSFILEYDGTDSSRFVLIDGGPAVTYARHLKYALDKTVTNNGLLDLVILSHVDNDHICGIINFLKDLKNKKKTDPQFLHINGIWHNTFEQNIGDTPRVLEMAHQARLNGFLPNLTGEIERGLDQGEQTSKLAIDLGIPMNAGFKDSLILSENAPAPYMLNNLKIWIVGPNQRNLERLRREWCAWLKEKTSKPVMRGVEKDTSIPNLSSLILLLEADGRRILLPGDGTSQDIIDGLKTLGKLDETGRIHVDILKLPHHGSKRNVSEEFFDKVQADIYVISANGQNNNPEFETLEWIITSNKRQRRMIQIYVTNETKSIKELKQKYDLNTLDCRLTVMEAGQHFATL